MEELRALLLSDSLITTVFKLLSQRTVVNSTEDPSRLKRLLPKNKDLKETDQKEMKILMQPASLLVISAIPQLKTNSEACSNLVELLRRLESLLIKMEEQEALLTSILKAMILSKKPSKNLELKLMAEPSELTTQVASPKVVQEEAEEAMVAAVVATVAAVVAMAVAVEAMVAIVVAMVATVVAMVAAVVATVVAVVATVVAVAATVVDTVAVVVAAVEDMTPKKPFQDNLSINRLFTIRTQI